MYRNYIYSGKPLSMELLRHLYRRYRTTQHPSSLTEILVWLKKRPRPGQAPRAPVAGQHLEHPRVGFPNVY
jgi:hypothetical protein